MQYQHDNVNDVLFMLTDQAAEIVGVTGAGVTLAQGGGYVCVSGTVTAVSDLERIVETTQQGPSIDAVVNERTVAITNLAADEYEQRWPTFVAQAKASSIRSVAALPMMAIPEMARMGRRPRPHCPRRGRRAAGPAAEGRGSPGVVPPGSSCRISVGRRGARPALTLVGHDCAHAASLMGG